MGYPVGPWYAESSNIDNANRLQRQAAADRRRDGHQRPARVDDAAGGRPDQGQQGLRAAGRPERQPRHGRRVRRAADAGLLRPPPAGSEPGPRRDDYTARASADDKPLSDRKPAVGQPTTTPRHPSTWPTLGGDKSELRGAIERYEADRGSLLRILPPAGSPQPRRAAPRLHRTMARPARPVDFDASARTARSITCCSRTTCPRAAAGRYPIKERAEWEPLVPFAPIDPRPGRRPPRAQADGMVEGRRRPDPSDQGDRRRARGARTKRPGPRSGQGQRPGEEPRRQPRPVGRRGPAEYAPDLVRLLRRLRPALHLVDGRALQGGRPVAPVLCQLPPAALRRLGLGAREPISDPGPVDVEEEAALPAEAVRPGGAGRAGSDPGRPKPPRRPPIATARSSARRSAATPCSAS